MNIGKKLALRSVLFTFIAWILTSCGGATDSDLATLGLTGAAADIAGMIAAAEQSDTFKAKFIKATGQKIAAFSVTMSGNLNDGQFVFEGVTYGKLKSALKDRAPDFSTLKSLDKTFGSTRTMFAAHGLSGKIRPDELKAFVKVATAGMQSLKKDFKGSLIKNRDITTRTIAGAMRVSLALDLIGPKVAKKVALALADDEEDLENTSSSSASSDTYGVCGAYSEDVENKNWLCFADEIGGAIGYYADASKSMWQDCCAPERKFKVCDDKHAPSEGGSWGWIPDPTDPTGQKGESCHRSFRTPGSTIKKFCETTVVDVDSWQCSGDGEEEKKTKKLDTANANADD
ncbi:MAG: hypothetical protein FJ146_01560 [Deltaproteobacteria bacterium]|nr:hypothetical protein [Deltaproteobacteria bacterium]